MKGNIVLTTILLVTKNRGKQIEERSLNVLVLSSNDCIVIEKTKLYFGVLIIGMSV